MAFQSDTRLRARQVPQSDFVLVVTRRQEYAVVRADCRTGYFGICSNAVIVLFMKHLCFGHF